MAFDPYLEWLDVPLAERPPDHYALLGLVRFESDVEKIRAAAQQRTAKLNAFRLGKRADDAQQLLEEVSRAFGTLEDAELKAAYDVTLGKRSETPTTTVAPTIRLARPIPVTPLVPPPTIAIPTSAQDPPAASHVEASGSQALPRWTTQRKRSKRSKSFASRVLSWALFLAAGVVAAIKVPPWLEEQGGIEGLAQGVLETPEGPFRKSAPGKNQGGITSESPAKPMWLPIRRQVVVEGYRLERSLGSLVSAPSATSEIRFRLADRAKTDASIDPVSAQFVWTPQEEHGPDVHSFVVEAYLEGVPNSAAQQTFEVFVQEENRPPVISDIPPLKIKAGEPTRFQLDVSDPDRPENFLEVNFDSSPILTAAIDANRICTVTSSSYFAQRLQAVLRVSDGMAETKRTVEVEIEASTPASAPAPVMAGAPLGRAPDLSGIAPWYYDEFHDPSTGWPHGTSSSGTFRGYEAGRYIIRTSRSQRTMWRDSFEISECICEVVGRVVGETRDQWGLAIKPPEAKYLTAPAVAILVGDDGTVEVRPNQWANPVDARGPSLPRKAYDVVKKGKEFNTLLVMVRRREVSVFVNGAPIVERMAATEDMDLEKPCLALWSRGPATAEFERIRIWPISALNRIP